MNRSLLAVVFIATIFKGTGAIAQLPQSFGFGAGVAFPLGSMRDSFHDGFQLSASFDARPSQAEPMTLRAEAGYSQFGLRGHAVTRTHMITAIANVVYERTSTVSHPYVIGGVGFYNIHRPAGPFTGSPASTTTSLGYNLGGGVSFHVRRLSMMLESRYHKALTDRESISFVPIVVGVRF